ncbi:MAG: restriction endonuclease subunit S [Phascolarctobacterium sp.]|nr:restriction endonuclease subunit S [Phascolarctobacterium sp.]
MVRLGEVATYINGYAFKPTDWSDKGVPIIRIQDLTGSAYKTNYFDGIVAEKYKVVSGDVLISWSASLGVYVWDKEDAVLNQHIFKVVFDKADVDESFFVHQVRNILDKAGNETHGATMKHLTRPVFDALEFYLPSKKVQRKIARTFDKIDVMIGQRSQQLRNLDELVKARFVEMFGDIVVNTRLLPAYILKDLASLITKGASPNWQGFNYTEDEDQTLFVTSENVRDGYLDFSKAKYIEDGFNEKQKRSVLQKGDFLINIVGASIGRAAQFNIDKKANINQAVSLVRVKDERIVDAYLLEYLNSEKALQMYFAMQSDTGRANLSLEDIGNLVILLPPVNEQKIFAAFVQQIDKSKLEVQKSLDKLQTLKKALMQKYFG